MLLQILVFVALGLLALCALLAWAFVFRYSRVRWHATAEGRHLMKFTIILALMFSLTLLFQVLQPKPLTVVTLSILLFGWAAFELGNRIRLQRVAQREAQAAASPALTGRPD